MSARGRNRSRLAETSSGRTECLPAQGRRSGWGAHIRDRTGDLSLTKTVLYLLSYVGMRPTLPVCNRLARAAGQAFPLGSPRVAALPEPVKGLEPITGGLQNRCSTVELHRQPREYRPARSRRSIRRASGYPVPKRQSSKVRHRSRHHSLRREVRTSLSETIPYLRPQVKRHHCHSDRDIERGHRTIERNPHERVAGL